jgi:hypothetical protein
MRSRKVGRFSDSIHHLADIRQASPALRVLAEAVVLPDFFSSVIFSMISDLLFCSRSLRISAGKGPLLALNTYPKIFLKG